MVLNATFINISVIFWWSVLLVEEIGVPGENHTDLPQVGQNFYHIMLYRANIAMSGIKGLKNEFVFLHFL
jgi:hypothetical protein